jgi:hypothetical protein
VKKSFKHKEEKKQSKKTFTVKKAKGKEKKIDREKRRERF